MTETLQRQYSTVISGGTLVMEHELLRADLAILDGRIAAIGDSSTWQADQLVDATGLIVMPGAVDPHTHWGSTGDFAAQCRADSRAAALGGTTTAGVLHRTTPDGFAAALSAASENSFVDFILSPSITSKAHADRIDTTINDESPSIKYFLSYRDVPGAMKEDTWNQLTPRMFEEALAVMGKYEGTVACVHAEDADVIAQSLSTFQRDPDAGLAGWALANPASAEVAAIRFASEAAQHADVPVYFVHLSGRDALNALSAAKAGSAEIFGETCPHYLYLESTSPAPAKFSPPIRTAEDREALWTALRSGLLDTVGSDNSTTSLTEKTGDIWSIRRGGPEAGFVLPIVLSEGVNRGRVDLIRAAAITATNAAKIFGIYPKKGVIAIGSDADLAIVDLNKEAVVDASLIDNTAEYTLYDGNTFRGWPVMTILRGSIVYKDGQVVSGPTGQYLSRAAAPRTSSAKHV